VVEGAPLGFRHRARLMLRGRARAPKLGLFREGTHRVVDVPECRIHHPVVNEVAAAARSAIRATATPPYSDVAQAGLVRALQVAVERPSGRAQVVIVVNDADPASTRPLADALLAALGARLQGLWWNGNRARGNAILGPDWRLLAGAAALRETIGGADVFFPPGAFGQSHPDLADALVARVHACVPGGARVAELYAGCGSMGLGLLRRTSRVVFNEENEHALEGLALGIAARPEAERARAGVAPGPAAKNLSALDGADVVIADPPRKGLDPELLDALRGLPPARLVYVSCGLASFLRDADRLLASGALRLASLEAFACFPYTEHAETLAVFARA
jgi:tRNA/tmRNA/rRNA uracil-C5-methylase (TrmA/RlmC/RlmD family)